MKKEIKLYNVIFPLWSFYLLPLNWIWAVIIGSNFIIDSFVFLAALWILKIPDRKIKYKKCILRIWGYGFLADFIGAGLLFFLYLLGYFGSDIANNPLHSPIAFAVTSAGVITAGICIYMFNYHKVLPLIESDDKTRRKIALILSFATMPYAMYIPTTMFL